MDLQFLRKAERLVEVKKWKILKKICLEQLRVNPKELYANYYLAISCMGEGNLQGAKSITRSLLSESSNNTDFMSLYVDILTQEKQFIDAESMIKDVLNTCPNDDFYLAQFAEIKLRLLQFNDAIDIAKKSLAINPSNDKATNILVLASEFTGNSSSYQLDEISGINPNNSFLLAKNIEALLQNDKISEAYDLVLSSLSLYPNNEYLMAIAEEAIGANSKFSNLLRNINFKIKSLILKNNSRLSAIVYVIVFSLIVAINLFDSSSFLANTLGYLIIIFNFFICFYLPINKLAVLSHVIGKRLYSKVDRKLINCMKILIVLGLIILFYGLLTSSRSFLLLSLVLLTNSIPLAYVVEAKGRMRKSVVKVYLLNIILLIVSCFTSSLELLLVSVYFNCLFLAVYAAIAAAEVIEDKYS